MSDAAALPLTGLQVVDLTSNIAAPWAGAILRDLGADVRHVESPAGDDSRRMSPVMETASAYFHVVNRGKQVVRLDLHDPGDRARLDAFLTAADVFLTNLRPDTLERHALDAASLARSHPRLIHAALSAYGPVGGERQQPGYDAVLQARTGVAAVTGEPAGDPVRAGVSILDMGAGTWLALAVLAALLRRERTGLGGSVTTSLFETGASWVSYHVAAHQVTGHESGRHGSRHPAFSPYGFFRTADGLLCLGIGGDGLFRRLCDALGCPELADDERAADNTSRVRHREWLQGRLEDVLSSAGAQTWVQRLRHTGLPVEMVQVPEDLLEDPQAEALDLFGTLAESGAVGVPPVRVPRLPFTIDGRRPPLGGGVTAPPRPPCPA